MYYFKYVVGGYIISVGRSEKPVLGLITEDEYSAIMEAKKNKPLPAEGFGYRLKSDLTWELYELPVYEEPDEDPELTDTDALAILLGGVV